MVLCPVLFLQFKNKIMSKQTAVEYLESKIFGDEIFSLSKVFEQAKEMEKEQITYAMNKGFNKGYEHGKQSDNESE